MLSKHFRLETIAAGKWERIAGTNAAGGSNEPRPHIVPITDRAKNYFGMTILMTNGLCPGFILRDGVEEKDGGYRFTVLTEDDARTLMAKLDREVDIY